MTTIKCPICKERLSGESGEQLSNGLKDHMASVHDMVPSGAREEGTRIPPTDYSEDTMRLREAEGPVRVSWKEEVRMWTPPPVPSGPGEARRGTMLYLERGPPSLVREREVEAVHQGDMPQMECPICSALIMSTSEEDLSDDLRDHMADQHDIRRKRLDWIYGRR